ncbi:MAG: hypothetical protein ACFFDT_17170, partial [Candidatus Hodarchaeota archaeon]
MVSESESDITEVLKALNHEIRREIIRILHKKQHAPYSDFLERLKLPASSNVAYHLSLLARAHLIEKDPEGKYLLTPLGRRSALLLDLATESKSSIFSDIYLGFSRLNPTEILLGAWWTFFFVLGFSILQPLLPLGIICILIAICSIVLIVFRTRTLWTLLLINNFIWIFFVPKYREFLASIIATNIFGLILLIPGAEFFIDISPFNIFLGCILLLISLILSILYLYVSVGRKLPIVLGRKEEE